MFISPVVLIKSETTASLTAKTVNRFIRSCQFSLKSTVTLEQLKKERKRKHCSVAACLPFRTHLHVLYVSIPDNYLSIFIPTITTITTMTQTSPRGSKNL